MTKEDDREGDQGQRQRNPTGTGTTERFFFYLLIKKY